MKMFVTIPKALVNRNSPLVKPLVIRANAGFVNRGPGGPVKTFVWPKFVSVVGPGGIVVTGGVGNTGCVRGTCADAATAASKLIHVIRAFILSSSNLLMNEHRMCRRRSGAKRR
jgi:hypothetical protein